MQNVKRSGHELELKGRSLIIYSLGVCERTSGKAVLESTVGTIHIYSMFNPQLNNSGIQDVSED